ncbi:uncharacterized protein [Temnothorax longispinosus]|uniref:uncharacterized protein isoform X2 n=1 Tax=Temnothorax longispinosus TaxID=300112 RepID=UPI003A99ABD5
MPISQGFPAKERYKYQSCMEVECSFFGPARPRRDAAPNRVYWHLLNRRRYYTDKLPLARKRPLNDTGVDGKKKTSRPRTTVRDARLESTRKLATVTIHGILLDANDAETCNLLCVQCNATAVFANGHCECTFDEGSDEVSGLECLHRIQKEIQAIELNMLSEDLTDEERNVRSILKYRRRLRPESAPYVSSIMHGAEMYPPILRATNPAITYPTTGLYDPFIQSPLPIHHALVRAVTLPAHVLHHVLHPRLYHHHRGIVRSTNLPSDTSDTGIVGQPICENNGDSTSNLPTARNNANKLAEQNVGFNAPSQYPYITHAEQPTLYHLPHTSYYSPLMNMLHPISGYVFQPVSQYTPPDPLTSASNPQSSCGNYANTEQRSVLTTDKAVYSNDETEKSDDATRNISKDEKKNGTDKS